MNYDLVFEGGGAKGLVFVGAMQAFQEAGHTYNRVVGTSAGAITASLLCAGFSTDELLRATSEKLADGRPRFASFMDVPQSFSKETIDNSLSSVVLNKVDNPLLPKRIEEKADLRFLNGLLQIPVYRNIFSLIERGGWYAGDAFVAWLEEKLNENGRGLGSATLAEFHNKCPDHELTVIAADTSHRERLILNHRTAPNLPVKWAVRMSMSIPFLWQEVVWQKEWGLYRNQSLTGDSIVDGGVLSNFAIDLLVSKDDEVQEMMGPPQTGSLVLGFLIDESLPVPSAEPAAENVPLESAQPSRLDLKQAQTIRRLSQLVDTMTNARDKFVISTYRQRVCRLPAKGYGTTEFDMSEQRIQAIVAAGHKTMTDFLKVEGRRHRRTGSRAKRETGRLS